MAAVSADGSTVCVLMRRLNSSCKRSMALVTEIGDFARFTNPRQLMAYVGLVPSEHSTGDSVRRGGITKAGNNQARRALLAPKQNPLG